MNQKLMAVVAVLFAGTACLHTQQTVPVLQVSSALSQHKSDMDVLTQESIDAPAWKAADELVLAFIAHGIDPLGARCLAYKLAVDNAAKPYGPDEDVLNTKFNKAMSLRIEQLFSGKDLFGKIGFDICLQFAKPMDAPTQESIDIAQKLIDMAQRYFLAMSVESTKPWLLCVVYYGAKQNRWKPTDDAELNTQVNKALYFVILQNSKLFDTKSFEEFNECLASKDNESTEHDRQ